MSNTISIRVLSEVDRDEVLKKKMLCPQNLGYTQCILRILP